MWTKTSDGNSIVDNVVVDDDDDDDVDDDVDEDVDEKEEVADKDIPPRDAK
jgi:hypothetical protein